VAPVIGQIDLAGLHGWHGSSNRVSEITETSDDKLFIDRHYPWTKRAFEKYGDKFQEWPRRTYVYME